MSNSAISKYLADIGRKGGSVRGVKKGLAALTPKQRRARASAAAKARWAKGKSAKLG